MKKQTIAKHLANLRLIAKTSDLVLFSIESTNKLEREETGKKEPATTIQLYDFSVHKGDPVIFETIYDNDPQCIQKYNRIKDKMIEVLGAPEKEDLGVLGKYTTAYFKIRQEMMMHPDKEIGLVTIQRGQKQSGIKLLSNKDLWFSFMVDIDEDQVQSIIKVDELYENIKQKKWRDIVGEKDDKMDVMKKNGDTDDVLKLSKDKPTELQKKKKPL